MFSLYFIGFLSLMKLSKSELNQGLWQLSQDYVDAYQSEFSHLPIVEKDEQWPSPCILEGFDEQHELWQPVKICDSLSFDNVEEAMQIALHSDIKEYFTSIYSEAIGAICEHGELSLLFAWSKGDFARLQENIIGHILMKQKLKQTISVFFAVTDDENYILSVNNESGEVWLEKVGCEPHKKLANNLQAFIESLSPSLAALTGKA